MNKRTLPTSEDKGAIGVSDGKSFTYPSTRTEGHDLVDLVVRAPAIAKQPPDFRVRTVKIKDLGATIAQDLEQAQREGDLRGQFDLHLKQLKRAGLVDQSALSTLAKLRDELTGDRSLDAETVEIAAKFLRSLQVSERGQV